ncbi:MAG: DUF2167 domain-containing protein [Verrucomicrobiaceae bacterium]|nr:MAG: DUF2167 domain-containing protein [Verrucomicrobiaceae bacterium]
MLTNLRVLLCGTALFLAIGSPLHSQQTGDSTGAPPATEEAQADPEAEAQRKALESIDWKTSGSGALGSIAELQVAPGYRFTGSPGTVKLMEMMGNLTSGDELGYIAPEDMNWFAVFEFSPVGYVKDDEKDKLDPDSILKQMKESQEAANEELTRRGMSTLTILGWQTPPFYNPATNNLEWAIRAQSSDGGQVINYKTKLLGRRGVMDVVLVCDEKQIDTIIPEYQKLLTGYSFKKEESYAAFTKGDKIAEYGLTGLIVGGGLLAAAKSGLLAKLWKPIVVGVVAVGAFLKRIFVGKTKETI